MLYPLEGPKGCPWRCGSYACHGPLRGPPYESTPFFASTVDRPNHIRACNFFVVDAMGAKLTAIAHVDVPGFKLPIAAEIQIHLVGILQLAKLNHRYYECRRAKAIEELRERVERRRRLRQAS